MTTGWAVLDREDVHLVAHGTILPEQVFPDQLKYLLMTYMPTRSVAERPVIFRGPLGNVLEENISHTRVILDHQVVFINPSDWKDSKYKKEKVPRGISQHERDAIRIGLWFWNTHLKGL